MSQPNRRILVYVVPSIYDEVAAEAEKEGMIPSYWVAVLIRGYFDRKADADEEAAYQADRMLKSPERPAKPK